MPVFKARRRPSETESTIITTRDRVRAVVRILLVAILALRLVRAMRRLPADISLLKAHAPSTA